MSEPDMRNVRTAIEWGTALYIVLSFLHQSQLPSTLVDKQLDDLVMACDKARKRLREQSGG